MARPEAFSCSTGHGHHSRDYDRCWVMCGSINTRPWIVLQSSIGHGFSPDASDQCGTYLGQIFCGSGIWITRASVTNFCLMLMTSAYCLGREFSWLRVVPRWSICHDFSTDTPDPYLTWVECFGLGCTGQGSYADFYDSYRRFPLFFTKNHFLYFYKIYK